MSLLTIVGEAAASISQPVPAAVAADSSPASVLWFNLAKREGNELARRHDWQALIVAHSFTAVALEPQAGALPSDYDHFLPDVQIWNRTNNTRYIGPMSSNEWMHLQSGLTGGVAGWWRLIAGVLNIYPAPTAGDTIDFEYVSKNWCEASNGTDQATWAADADVGLIPERLMSLGLTWRWLKSKGMDYAEDMATYEREVERAAARDRGLAVMVVGKGHDDVLSEPAGDVMVTP